MITTRAAQICVRIQSGFGDIGRGWSDYDVACRAFSDLIISRYEDIVASISEKIGHEIDVECNVALDNGGDVVSPHIEVVGNRNILASIANDHGDDLDSIIASAIRDRMPDFSELWDEFDFSDEAQALAA